MIEMVKGDVVWVKCIYKQRASLSHEVSYVGDAKIGGRDLFVLRKDIKVVDEDIAVEAPKEMANDWSTVRPTSLDRIFDIPDSGDEEIIAIHILYKILNDLNHSTQHRVLDYFKSRFNVSKPVITKND